jgi:hypothetical protein
VIDRRTVSGMPSALTAGMGAGMPVVVRAGQDRRSLISCPGIDGPWALFTLHDAVWVAELLAAQRGVRAVIDTAVAARPARPRPDVGGSSSPWSRSGRPEEDPAAASHLWAGPI